MERILSLSFASGTGGQTTIGYEQVVVDLTAWLARHEPDPHLKAALDFALLEDFDHLYRYSNLYDLLYGGHADELMRRLEGRDPAELLPKELPATPVTFEPNKDYVRQVLADTIDLRTDGLDYVPLNELPDDHRYFRYQQAVNEGGAPTDQVIEQIHQRKNHEYRDQTEGDHPVADLQTTVETVS